MIEWTNKWTNEWIGLSWRWSQVIYQNCIKECLAKNRCADWKLLRWSFETGIIFPGAPLSASLRAKGSLRSYMESENTYSKGCFCRNRQDERPLLSLSWPAVSLGGTKPTSERGRIQAVGGRKGSVWSPVTPLLTAGPPPFPSLESFDLTSLSSRHTLVDNSRRHQNLSTIPSAPCSLQELRAILMGSGQACSISWGLGWCCSPFKSSPDCSHEIQRCLLPGRKAVTNLGSVLKKQRHRFVDKGPCSESYGFSSSHVKMCEWYHKEGWALKNWCFWTVLLEKTLESPLDYKEIKPVNPKGNQS